MSKAKRELRRRLAVHAGRSADLEQVEKPASFADLVVLITERSRAIDEQVLFVPE